MGKTIFRTDLDAGRVLLDEINAPGYRLRRFTMAPGSVCVLMRCDLAVIDQDVARLMRGVYAVPQFTGIVYSAVICLHSGLDGIGPRSVSLKLIDEAMGPYQTGGADGRLLGLLTPLKPADKLEPRYQLPHKWATAWRERAYRDAQARDEAAA